MKSRNLIVNLTMSVIATSFYLIANRSNSQGITINCPPPVTVKCFFAVPPPNPQAVSAHTQCPEGGLIVTWEGPDVETNETCPNKVTITRTYKAIDNCNNEQTCTQIITVFDDVPPTITCPPLLRVKCLGEIFPAVFTGLVSDNCGGVDIHATDDISGFCDNQKSVTRTWTAIDGCGNEAQCVQLIEVFDDIPPEITCPGPLTFTCSAEVPEPNIAEVIASDNCGMVTVSHVSDAFTNITCVNRYTITRTYKAVDRCNNEKTCTQIITVNDNIPPTIECPTIDVSCPTDIPATNAPIIMNLIFVTDNCAGDLLVFFVEEDIIEEVNEYNFKLKRTYKVVDICGNEAFGDVIINVKDDIKPIINCPPNRTVLCHLEIPPEDFAGGTASDNCSPVDVYWIEDIVTDFVCENKKKINRKYRVYDRNNNFSECIQVITVFDDRPPAGGCTNINVKCAADIPPVNSLEGVHFQDNCDDIFNPLRIENVVNTVFDSICPNKFKIFREYKATDACGNSTICEQVITVNDDISPTITAAAEITVPFTSGCDYQIANPPAHDNCDILLSYSFTDEKEWCGNNLVIRRRWVVSDACENSTVFVQTITVTDNATEFIIYADSEVKFGEGSSINGDVGVTAANGKAEFKKNSVLDDYEVFAKNITVQSPATVNNKHFEQATGGPAPPNYSYGGIGLSGNHTQSLNGEVPAGNYKKLTIKKGVSATINGSNYGSVIIEENADVTFTSSSIDMEDLNVRKGKSPGTTKVHFEECTAVRMKGKVDIEEDTRINVLGPKLIFYMGHNKEFAVKSNYTEVTANVYGGKLSVTGKGNGGAQMTGWYIIEKLDGDAKNVTWNPYDCTPLARELVTGTKSNHTTVNDGNPGLNLKVYPNPSSSEFQFRLSGQSDEQVRLSIIDVTGRIIFLKYFQPDGLIRLGSELKPGTYIAMLQQGSNIRTIKLFKMQ